MERSIIWLFDWIASSKYFAGSLFGLDVVT